MRSRNWDLGKEERDFEYEEEELDSRRRKKEKQQAIRRRREKKYKDSESEMLNYDDE